jgi:hypothetical protein
MERRGRSISETSVHPRRMAPRVGAAFLGLAGALALGGCIVVPAHTAYVPPPRPVYVSPAPVYVVPAPAYGYYGWRRHGHW